MIDNLEVLEQKIERLIKRMESVQKSLALAETDKADAIEQLDQKDGEIATLKKELAESLRRGQLVWAKLENLVKRLGLLEPVVDKLKLE